MREWRRKITVVTITTIMLSACSVSSRQNEFSRHLEYPSQTQTRATNFLGCFGDMLTTYRTNGASVTPLKIAIVDVKDATNVSSASYPDSEIPNNFTDMTLGLVSKIGGPVRISHIPSSSELLDAARYKGINPKGSMLGDFRPSHYDYSRIQLYGALTEYDRVVDSKKRNLDGGFEIGGGSATTDLNVTASKVRNVARMTMDFRVASANVGDVVNNSSSTNTVQVYQYGNDLQFGISVDGQSIGYSHEISVVDARHKAIRLLIEWGIVEALGRYSYVPYWKCLPNSDNPKQIGYKDLVSSNQLYDFHNFNRGDSLVRLRNKSKVSLVDMRDKLLINAVMSDFINAEYVDQEGTRKSTKRKEKNATLIQRSVVGGKIVDSKSVIDGKATVRRDVLAHYRKDSKYAKLSDSALLKQLHSEFVAASILSPKDNMMGLDTYIALWLNVPVMKGARWMK